MIRFSDEQLAQLKAVIQVEIKKQNELIDNKFERSDLKRANLKSEMLRRFEESDANRKDLESRLLKRFEESDLKRDDLESRMSKRFDESESKRSDLESRIFERFEESDLKRKDLESRLLKRFEESDYRTEYLIENEVHNKMDALEDGVKLYADDRIRMGVVKHEEVHHSG